MVLFRYPNVACELLTSDVQIIVDQMTANDVSFDGVVVVKLLISNPFQLFFWNLELPSIWISSLLFVNLSSFLWVQNHSFCIWCFAK